MNHNVWAKISAGILLLILAGPGLASCFMKDLDISQSERRRLAVFPELSIDTLSDGSYMKQMELYLQDRFVCRDLLRGAKAEIETSLLGKSDSDGYYQIGTGIYKLDSELNQKNIIRAAENFSEVAVQYFPQSDIYYSVIPDKSYYAAEEAGYPSLDYRELDSFMAEHMQNAVYIPIYERLSVEDYYRTDPHWRQECILDVADLLLEEMSERSAREPDAAAGRRYQVNRATVDFRGGYAGASAFFTEPEELNYVMDRIIEQAVVYDFEKKAEADVYAWDKLEEGTDPYDFFLWGARALLTIKNPQAEANGKKLIIFRDSFGSSIAPLLLEGYEEITLIDLRYVTMKYAAALLGDREYEDVLFLYSGIMLNHSDSMRFE